MSCNYADGLSPYEYKGEFGMKEVFDSPDILKQKISLLADWIKVSKYTVFHTGAGISTSAGIPDFRGPNGVWTLEKKGQKPEINIDFNDAKPTFTHMAIKSLINNGYAKYVVSQNIDGLHLKSGLPRQNISEVHGNMFTMKCNKCKRTFVNNTAVKTVGQKCLQIKCLGKNKNHYQCRGLLYDTILDWEHQLPVDEFELAELHSRMADLCICLGTSLQIQPINLVPFNAKKNKGKVVICNLQKTNLDRKADLVINTYVDELMMSLMSKLGVNIEKYDNINNPICINKKLTDWTIYEIDLNNVRNLKKNITKYKKQKKSIQLLELKSNKKFSNNLIIEKSSE